MVWMALHLLWKMNHHLLKQAPLLPPFTPGTPAESSPPDTSDESPDIRKCQELPPCTW